MAKRAKLTNKDIVRILKEEISKPLSKKDQQELNQVIDQQMENDEDWVDEFYTRYQAEHPELFQVTEAERRILG